MKKTILFLSAVVISAIALDSCKKGADDPMISIWSRKHRLTGDWKITSGTSTSTSGGTTTTTTWTNSTVTQTSGSSSQVGTAARYNLSIVKDGTWKLDEGYTTTFGSSSVITTITANGTWNWTGRVGADKNKDHIVLKTLQQTTLTGSTSSVDTYTGDSAPVQVYYIDELKNKELKFTWTGTSSSGGSASTDSGNMLFNQ